MLLKRVLGNAPPEPRDEHAYRTRLLYDREPA
jgi:hypothetical protein